MNLLGIRFFVGMKRVLNGNSTALVCSLGESSYPSIILTNFVADIGLIRATESVASNKMLAVKGMLSTSRGEIVDMSDPSLTAFLRCGHVKSLPSAKCRV